MQINLYTIVIGLMIGIILVLVSVMRKKMTQHGAREVFVALILVLFSLFFFGLSLLITSDIRLIFHEMKFVTFAFMAPWTVFIYLAFTGNADKLSLRNRLLLCVIPLITVILAMTNPLHHYFRADIFVVEYNNVTYVKASPSWWYWVYSVYSYLLYIIGILILATNYYKRPRMYRNQIGLMIATSVAAVAIAFASMLKLFPDHGDIAILSCAVVCIVQYITLVQFSHKQVVTKARNLVVGEIDSIVLIFDQSDRLVDSNKDAQRFLGALQSLLESNTDGKEIFLPDSGEYFSVSNKRMYDDNGKPTGRVVLLNDITGLKTTVNELEHILTHDYLTGLKNRHAFHRELRRLTEPDLPAALVSINIPEMDLIYNIYGHEYGDKAIVRLAAEVKRLAGQNPRNSCARLTSDEMGVALIHADEEGARNFVDIIRKNLAAADIRIDARIAIMSEPGQDAEQLFMDAAEIIQQEGPSIDHPVSDEFFNSLKKALEFLRDKTGQRYRRISELCLRVADRLELSEQDKARLQLLTTMADIGLLSVSPTIVPNIGNLSNAQWEEMKLHTVKGHNAALSLPELSGIAKEILSHHERFDGCGYPMGLKGDDIPLLSRIFSAVEFYVDAPEDRGAKLLRTRSGTQFDPQVTDAILSMLYTLGN